MKSRVFAPAILSGLLLWTAYFPLNLGPVAYVALVPFLTLARADGIGTKRRYLAAFLGGLTFYILALKWIRVAHPMMELFAWPGLSLYCALYWPLALYLVRRLDRLGLPLVLTFPLVWVALEYTRAHFPTGFSFLIPLHAHQLIGFGWYFLGYTQHAVLPLIQAADIGGVYLVSLVVAAINGAVYEWVLRSRRVRRLLRWPAPWVVPTFYRETVIAAGAVTFLMILFMYGIYRMGHAPFAAGPEIAAIQGNLPQNEKMLRGDDVPAGEAPPLEREYFPLADRAAHPGGARRKPDLVIWPETCFPLNWMELPSEDADVPDTTRHRAQQITTALSQYTATRMGTNTLYGLNAIEWRGGRPYKYNSALLVLGNGTIAGRYDKIHLVPFGEYVPLKDQLPWLQSFTPYTNDYSCTPGSQRTRFELPTAKGTYRFGVLICYEDSEPYLARQYNLWSRDRGGADFLVNISNDGWFDGTEEHEQHLAICRFRAVEARRSIVRAVNMGVSAVIDADGRVVALPGDSWEQSKKMHGIVRAAVPLDTRGSFYAATGDWVPLGCWALIVAGLISLWLQSRRSVART